MLDNFYTNVLSKDPRFTSLDTLSDVSLLEPGTRAAVAKLIVLCHEASHELRVGETFRSQARQEKVFADGASQLKKVGTHGYGLAADLKLFIGGVYDPKGEDYIFLQKMCLKVGLISGIDWGRPNEHHDFHDWDHVQRIPIFRQKALFAGEWYPSLNYDPYEDMRSNNITF